MSVDISQWESTGLGPGFSSQQQVKDQKKETQTDTRALRQTSSVTISERGAENTGGSTGQPDEEAETGEDIIITP